MGKYQSQRNARTDEYVRRMALARNMTKIMQKMDGFPETPIRAEHWKKAYVALEAAGWPDAS